MNMLNKIQTIRPTLFKITDSVRMDSGVVLPCISGQLSQAGIISQNGYRYRESFWPRILNDSVVQEQVTNRDMLGMIEHPVDDDAFLKTPYEEASHLVFKTWLQGNEPFGTFAILNNVHGNNLKALIDVGHRPGVSTRGLGTFGQDQVSQYVDEENYALITWDIVKSPNFASLKMDQVTDSLMAMSKFKEVTSMYHLRDSADEHYNRQNLISDIGKLINELNEKYELLKKC